MKTWQKWIILGLFLLTVLIGCLTGCSSTTDSITKTPDSERWVPLEQEETKSLTTCIVVTIFYDKETGVEYICTASNHGDVEIEPLLDSDGTPLLYEGYEEQ